MEKIDPYPHHPEILELPRYVDAAEYLERCKGAGGWYAMDAVSLAWNEGYLAGKAARD